MGSRAKIDEEFLRLERKISEMQEQIKAMQEEHEGKLAAMQKENDDKLAAIQKQLALCMAKLHAIEDKHNNVPISNEHYTEHVIACVLEDLKTREEEKGEQHEGLEKNDPAFEMQEEEKGEQIEDLTDVDEDAELLGEEEYKSKTASKGRGKRIRKKAAVIKSLYATDIPKRGNRKRKEEEREQNENKKGRVEEDPPVPREYIVTGFNDLLPAPNTSGQIIQLIADDPNFRDWISTTGVREPRFVQQTKIFSKETRRFVTTIIWMDDNTMNTFIRVIRDMYLDWQTAKVWPIGTTFALGIKIEHDRSTKCGEPFEIQNYWRQIENGDAKDELACPPWHQLNYLLIPANLWESHWVVVAVDFEGKRVCVLDPFNKGTDAFSIEKLYNAVIPIIRTVLRLMHEGDFYSVKPKTDIQWSVHIIHPSLIPIQPDAVNCGPWCCMMIEDMVRKRAAWTLFRDKRWSTPLRRYIATTVFQRSLTYSHNDYNL